MIEKFSKMLYTLYCSILISRNAWRKERKTNRKIREKLIKSARLGKSGKSAKVKDYCVVIVADESAYEKVAPVINACARCGYPVFAYPLDEQADSVVGYFVKVVLGEKTELKLSYGVTSCYGVKTEFIYANKDQAIEVYDELSKATLDFANCAVTVKDNAVETTLCASVKDKFEYAVMAVARVATKYCPLVKVKSAYSNNEQDYDTVNALMDLPQAQNSLVADLNFREYLSVAKAKLYCELTIKEDEPTITLLDIIATIIAEAKK